MSGNKTVRLFIKKNGRVVKNPDGTNRTRQYPFFPNGGGAFTMKMDVSASEEIERLIAAVPHAGRSGLRKLAYYAVKNMKKEARRGGPSGESWPALSEVTKRFPYGLKGREVASRSRKREAFFGEMIRALAYYRHPAPTYKVEFGFLSRSAYRRGTDLQRGKHFSTTRKMRQLYFGRGLHRPAGGIRIPARNLIGPSFRLHRRELIALFEQETRRVFQKRAKA